MKHTSMRCNQEDQLKSARLELQYSWEEEERAPHEEGNMLSLLGILFFLCGFNPIYGIANIPLSDVECDVDIAHVLEVRAPDCEIAIALEYIVLRFRY